MKNFDKVTTQKLRSDGKSTDDASIYTGSYGVLLALLKYILLLRHECPKVDPLSKIPDFKKDTPILISYRDKFQKALDSALDKLIETPKAPTHSSFFKSEHIGLGVLHLWHLFTRQKSEQTSFENEESDKVDNMFNLLFANKAETTKSPGLLTGSAGYLYVLLFLNCKLKDRYNLDQDMIHRPIAEAVGTIIAQCAKKRSIDVI
jgi:hypothetical protein